MKPILPLLALSLLVPAAKAGELRLATPFADHMVVQAGKPVALWGWAEPGAQVLARMGERSAQTAVDAHGRWRLELPSPAATADPFAAHTIEVRCGDATRELGDVLVGEVWLASGQSNMEWQARNCLTAELLAARGILPGVRMFTVQRSSVPEPAEDVVGSWQVFGPETFGGFSAVGVHFALALHDALGVPVGIVHSSWGGSSVEAWIGADALARTEAGRARFDAWRRSQALAEANRKTYPQPVLAGDDAQGWAACDLPVDFESLVPGFDGVIWFRREVVLPPEWNGHATALRLGQIDDGDTVWLDGSLVGETFDHMAQRRYVLQGAASEALADGRAMLVVRVEDTGGWGGFHAPAEEIVLEHGSDATLAIAGGWSWKCGARGPNLPPNHRPAYLDNGMLEPLVGLPLAGFIWYQGESNAGDPRGYAELFPALITDWRTRFGQGDLPFYWVQLANFLPGGGDWPGLRESQRKTLALPHTGMAVTIDVGNPRDIHPRDKRSVGERLARWALADTYGRDVVRSGPLVERAALTAAGVQVSFETFGSELAARGGGELRGFELAGPDGSFHPAQARLDGGAVVVTSAEVPEPRQVRYAWADDPSDAAMGANLVNDEGTPASPFRQDVETR